MPPGEPLPSLLVAASRLSTTRSVTFRCGWAQTQGPGSFRAEARRHRGRARAGRPGTSPARRPRCPPASHRAGAGRQLRNSLWFSAGHSDGMLVSSPPRPTHCSTPAGRRARNQSPQPCKPPGGRGLTRLHVCIPAEAGAQSARPFRPVPGRVPRAQPRDRDTLSYPPIARPASQLVPREADRIMSGNWGVVAIWVTHPLWPLRVPRRVICSVMAAAGAGVAAATRMDLDTSERAAAQPPPPPPREEKRDHPPPEPETPALFRKMAAPMIQCRARWRRHGAYRAR